MNSAIYESPQTCGCKLTKLVGLSALLCAAFMSCAFAQADKLTPNISGQPRTRAVLADRIVAVINDETVTMRELEDRVRVVKGQLAKQNVSLPPDDILQSQVLERLIMDRAQVQFAREGSIRVDDAQLERALERIAEQNRMTMVQFRDALERDGVSFNRFREEIRTEIIVTRLRQSEVENRIVVSEGEIDNFMAQNSPTGTEEINLGHILVRVPENASADQLEARRKRAEQALAQIKGGADFAQVAVTFSDSPEGLSGGSLGFRAQDRLPQLFVDATAALRKNDVSEVVRSPNGFHILKVLDRRGSGAVPTVMQTRARHILIRTSEVVSQDQARRRLIDVRERLLAKAATFCDMAKQFSADGSASKCGDLGVIYPGDTVPEFEKAMDALKIGELSEPVQSPFGWHLIEVMERGAADMSRDRMRQAARNAIRERKSDEAYQEWLRQLRDRTFVENRLEEG